MTGEAILIFVLILGPFTALLAWTIIAEVRGVPAFEETERQPSRLDAFGRSVLALVCLSLAIATYLTGGVELILIVATAIAALALIWATLWTLGQSAQQLLARRTAKNKNLPRLPSLRPIHARFVANFRRTLIDLPLLFLAY